VLDEPPHAAEDTSCASSIAAACHSQIDDLVYELYGLTDEDRKTIAGISNERNLAYRKRTKCDYCMP